MTSNQVQNAFSTAAEDRQPNISAVVIAACAAGEYRVIRGGEGNIEGRRSRDELVWYSWQVNEALQKVQDGFYAGPFENTMDDESMLEV